MMEVEILLARAQAWALNANREVEQAEVLLRRAMELGSSRGEERIILDLRLGQDDYAGVRRRLIEFRDRMAPERVSFYEVLSLALEGQISAETSICLEELSDQELFGRAVLAHALAHPDATELLEKALSAKNTEWKQRKLEELLLQRLGEANCSLCEQEPATRRWQGEKPLCAACARQLEDPNTLLRVLMGDQSPDALRMAAWIGEDLGPEATKELLKDLPPGAWVDGAFRMEMPSTPSKGILLQLQSEDQLLDVLPASFRDKLVRPLSLGQLMRILLNEPSFEEPCGWSPEQVSDLTRATERWPMNESDAFWALQTAYWGALLDSETPTPTHEAILSNLFGTVQLNSPEHSLFLTNRSFMCHMVYSSGTKLAPESVGFLESLLAERSADIFLRTLLLGAYQYGDSRKDEIGVWFIQNLPRLEFTSQAYRGHSSRPQIHAAAVNAWAQHILANPDDPAVLGNAAGFFSTGNNELVEALYSRCLELEPENPEWYERLSTAVARSSRDRSVQAKALSLMERALELEGAIREYNLTSMLSMAVNAEEDEKAELWAKELLETAEPGWNEGNALHKSHLTLGRLALKAGEIEEAERRLILAGQIPTTPQLGSFGPNMVLAQELLQRGRRQAVLEYLEECKTFWDMGLGQLEKWIAQVQSGETPEFGPNLRY